jgi:hypothetical protein
MKKSLILAFFLIAAQQASAADCRSEGMRVGVIQKFSLKGMVNKSWEGEMVQQGVRTKSTNNGGGVTNIWKFSVLDAAVAKKVDAAAFDGGEVAVRYCQQPGISLMGQTDTNYLVTDVRARPAN